ncbi:transcription termination factor NusA [Rhodopirellula sp. MGV]|uniref:transcription termination factor NusA n=1 Tax=Rhodopirellula sp. MGV TaxID=2023130 RepID=UPI000B95CEFE|nr:transcription termination factor NusA [Rhodopirellula sp. MGV]OYP35699.1 transcription termination factor NusA [Rhodopirellula sp. MGV]PNY34995.1 transcription termination factor NusA [Rhodopirellula baltica]
MNPQDILRYVDSLHREKNIDTELVFAAIEAALQTAAKRQYGEDADLVVRLDRDNGRINATLDGEALGDDQIGRIGAQTAKQVIIQKVREAERDSLMSEYREQIGEMVAGIIGRADGGVATVNLGNVEAILPRSEQIPHETLHAGERVRAVVFEVKSAGNRVRVVLSRTRPQLVQRLFEQEIPEISEGVIAVNSISREPGYRSKVAVSSEDSQVDPIAVCVGYRGSRIKAVREELAGEHIDVVRYSDDPEVLIPNALQPAEVEQVLLCDLIGRAIVLVQEDQLSLAIGRRGQNVRLASKLCGWDIEIMTAGELEEQIERAVMAFSQLEGMTPEISQVLVEQGYLSYDDLSVIEPDQFMEMSGLTAEQVDYIVDMAEQKAEEAEEAAAIERQARREQERGGGNSAPPAPVAEEETGPEAGDEVAESGDEAVDAQVDAAMQEAELEDGEAVAADHVPADTEVEEVDEVQEPVNAEAEAAAEEPVSAADPVAEPDADEAEAAKPQQES